MLILLGQHHTGQIPFTMFSEKFQTILQRKKILRNVVVVLLGQHRTGKTLCNVIRNVPDNIAQEKPSAMLSE